MTSRYTPTFITLGLMALALHTAPALAQNNARSTSSSSATASSGFVDGQVVYFRQAAPAVSRSLESSPEDAAALSSAGKSGDLDQVRALLQKHGFSAEQLDGVALEVHTIVSPRDPASGLPTGKRQASTGDGSTTPGGAASKIKITITVSIKPPKLIITIIF